MPLYAYRCTGPEHHEFEKHVKLDGSDAPTRCTLPIDPESVNCRCDAAVERIITAPARSFPGADSWRR
jgi:predicted nucleic acid-binding Zn ribbon protein